jgi:hypothetical protein
MDNFADTSAFNADVKEKNTKTNKITIVKNKKLATQNFLFNSKSFHFFLRSESNLHFPHPAFGRRGMPAV